MKIGFVLKEDLEEYPYDGDTTIQDLLNVADTDILNGIDRGSVRVQVEADGIQELQQS